MQLNLRELYETELMINGVYGKRIDTNIRPPTHDRKQNIKNKNNRSLSFHFYFEGLSVCGFVGLSGFADFRTFPYILMTNR